VALPQLHAYVPERVAARIRARAKARGIPVSRYLAELIQRDVDLGWPANFFDRVVGHWKGEALRRPRQGRVEERDTL
jgi:hypothetical protein